MAEAPWFKTAVFYEIYVRAFRDSNGDGHGDLRGVMEKLDYLQALGVTCLWLQPVTPSPLKDDGYDVAQHYDIQTRYGDLDDFQALLAAVQRRGMRLIIDMVLNHTSDRHPWFRSARSNPHSPFRDYYVWSETNTRYPEARVIFRDAETSNWAWDELAQRYYWHRFYSSQPDLNYDDARLQREMLNIISFWLDLGVDGFRLDAVPFLFERDGTNCENLPETHAFLRKVRSLVEKNYPGRVLLAEASAPPSDVRSYFGNGRNEFHMALNFPLMTRIFMALRRADRASLEAGMRLTPRSPGGSQWCNFLRNHDELTLEMLTPEEREWLWQAYAPEPQMRINLGIRRRLAPLLDGDVDRISLAHSLLFSLPGSPIMYYGDEIGMGDDVSRPDRDGLRAPMQWTDRPGAGFTSALEAAYAPVLEDETYGYRRVNVAQQLGESASVLRRVRRMLRARNAHKAFGLGNFHWRDLGALALACYQREFEGETLLVINNLGTEPQQARIPSRLRGAWLDLLSNETVNLEKSWQVQPLGYAWLLRQPS